MTALFRLPLVIAVVLVASLLVNGTPSTSAATFSVINAEDDGPGSLRQAILDANAAPGTDTITFNVPGTGPHTIRPASALPTITDPLVIDGYTQPGASLNTNPLDLGSNAVLLIELDGSAAGPGTAGLTITAGNSTVRGLVINRFNDQRTDGIRLLTEGGNVIEGNFIGTDVTGTADLGNSGSGIVLDGGSDNRVAGNVIASNRFAGVVIQGDTATGNVIEGNYIGTDVTGTADLGNAGDGIVMERGSNRVVGNVISSNLAAGVLIFGAHTSSNVIEGNFIGTDRTGRIALGQKNGDGIAIHGSADNRIVGNVISSNNSSGVNIVTGFAVGATATGNLVQGNFIGTDITGTAALGNIHGSGVLINESADTSVLDNVISSNGASGVHIEGIDATGNVVQGNFIGTDITGTAALGNRGAGVIILGALNTVGGTTAPAGNIIAFNGDQGVSVSAGTGNAILSNAIFSNELLGIALGEPSRVTANDAGDRDTGANNLQNFPVLTSAAAGDSAIAGTLNSTANTLFRLEFFANAVCDPSGHGEGETFLGSTTVTTNGAGDIRFTATLPGMVRAGHFLTATATDPGGNTSGFSACFQPTLSVTAGGQFLFWNLGSGWTASDWFTLLTIAWLFNRDLVNWTSFIPALGQTDFALVDGAVLWLVSPIDQELTPESTDPVREPLLAGQLAHGVWGTRAPTGSGLFSQGAGR